MFTVLLDAPSSPLSRIQIAKLGDFTDPRYGEFSITGENVANWQRNLSKMPGGEALIDFEHRSERKPRDSSAAGWITGIDLDGDKVMADARWTSKGKSAIKDEVYRFLSPVFGPTTVENETLDDALPSVALTNKPFLGSMPAVCLATDERVSEALDEDPAARFYTRALDGELGELAGALVMLDVDQAERDQAVKEDNALPDGSYPIRNVKQLKAAAILAASKHGNWKAAQTLIKRRAKELGVALNTLAGFGDSTPAKALDATADSRPPMDKDTLKLLGLPEDADDAKILDAVTALKATADKPAEPADIKTLDQLASDEGKVVLDQAAFTKIQLEAAQGAAAAKQLHEQTFDHAFGKALDERKVSPGEKDTLHKVYELDADIALKLMDERQAIVPEAPIGNPAIELDLDAPADAGEVAAAGLHPGSHETYRQVQAELKRLDLPQSKFTDTYMKMLDDGALR